MNTGVYNNQIKLTGLDEIDQEDMDILKDEILRSFRSNINFNTFPYMTIEEIHFEKKDKGYISIIEIKHDPELKQDIVLSYPINGTTYTIVFVKYPMMKK